MDAPPALLILEVKMKKVAIVGLLAFTCLLTSGAGSAHSRFYGGLYIGGPVWRPAEVYYAPPVYYPPPVYVERVAPPVYVERAAPPVYIEQHPASADYWYYCEKSQTYYPYAQSCSGNWMKVVPSGARPPH